MFAKLTLLLRGRKARIRLPSSVQTDSGIHPASYPMGNCGSFHGGGEDPGLERDPSPPAIVKVKKGEDILTLISSCHSA
jgi:hypothetical protein